MAIASIGTLGTALSTVANQATLVLTTSAAAEAGNFIVLAISVDNMQTTDGDSTAVSGVVDSTGGNVWKRAKGFANGQGTNQTGADISIWYCDVFVTIPSSGTITATFTNATLADASAMSAWEFSKGAGKFIGVEGTPGGLANDAASAGSLNVTTANISCLRFRAIAAESSSTTALTPTGGWTIITQAVSGAGTSNTEMGVRGEFIISTATGAASAPTGGAGAVDHASAYVAFKEVDIAPYARVQGRTELKITNDTTIANSFAAAVTSGNCVVGLLRWYDESQTITSVTDNQSNTYNVSSKLSSGAGTTATAIFWRGNITNAPTTITVTFSAAAQYKATTITEFSGVLAATDPKDVAPAGQDQSGLGSGTDNVTSGNITTVTDGCLIWGATETHDSFVLPTSGTGFSTSDTLIETATFGIARGTECRVQTTAGSVAATFSTTGSNQLTLVLALKPPVSAITGTLAATEPIDVAAFAGSVVVSGTLAATEAIDTANFAGSVVVSGTLAATDATDTAAFAGEITAGSIAGTLAATDALDTAAFAGSVVVSGALAATDAIDVASFAGGVTTMAALAATDVKDTASLAGSVAWTAALAVTEAKDVAAFAGGVLVAGTLAAVEANDTAAFSDIPVPVIGALVANEAGVSLTNYSFPENSIIGYAIGGLSVTGIDTAVFDGSVAWTGTLAATEAKDVAAFAGTLPNVIAGTLAANEAGVSLSDYDFPANSAIGTVIGAMSVVGIDTAAFIGAVGVNGVLAATDAKDTALFNGQVIAIGINGSLAATEAKDTAAFNGTVAGIYGPLVATEAKDVAAFNGTVVIAAQLAATEAKDTAAFTGSVGVSGTLGASETPDVALFNGRIGSAGALAATEAKDIAAFVGVLTVSGTLVATEAPDTAAFAGISFPLGELFGVLEATEAPDTANFVAQADLLGTLAAIEAKDIANFVGQVGDEEFPADFASWKFGQRFDRSLTRRFPWQDSGSRMR